MNRLWFFANLFALPNCSKYVSCASTPARGLITNSFHDIPLLFLFLPALGLLLWPCFAPMPHKGTNAWVHTAAWTHWREDSAPVWWPRTRLQPQIPAAAALKFSFSIRRSIFTGPHCHVPLAQGGQRSTSNEVQVLHSPEQLQTAPATKLWGGSSLGRALGSQGVWGNVAQGHLWLGLQPLVQDLTWSNNSSLRLGSWQKCRTSYSGKGKNREFRASF